MSKLKLALRRLFMPKGLFVLLGTLLTVCLMVYVFVLASPPRWIAYICYFISAYCLVILCIWLVRGFLLYLKTPLLAVLRKNRYIDRYLSDIAFKTVVSVYLSLALNLLYVAMNFFTGIYYRSLWSLTLAVYYFSLTVMRFMLLRNTKVNALRTDLKSEYIKYKRCAYVLLLMNFVLIGIVVLAIHYNNGFRYNGYLIYIMAIYAFYNIISAIIRLVKYKKLGSPVMSASKVICFASALVSILSLEMAMLSSFDTTGNYVFRNRTIGMTGLVISATFILTSGYMILHARQEISKQKNESDESKEDQKNA